MSISAFHNESVLGFTTRWNFGHKSIIVWLSILALSCDINAPKPGTQTLVTDGLKGSRLDGYWLYLPKTLDPTKKYPVILFLSGGHGVSSQKITAKEEGPAKFVFQEFVDPEFESMLQDSFIIINPHLDIGPPETRGWENHTETLQMILESIIEKYSGDHDRIFLTGLSHGAHGTWRVAKELPDRFLALAPIAGRIECATSCENIKDLPMWIAHNTGDRIVRARNSLDVVAHFEMELELPFYFAEDLSFDPIDHDKIFTLFDQEGHDAWNQIYSNKKFYEWLLNQ